MRRSELLGLSWSNLDLDAGELHVTQALVVYGAMVSELKEPKSRASRRDLPVDPRAAAALRRLRKLEVAERLAAGEAYNRASELVFVDEIGDQLSPDRVSATFRRLVKAAGLPALTLHGLRHTFAMVSNAIFADSSGGGQPDKESEPMGRQRADRDVKAATVES
jgi:integrase